MNEELQKALSDLINKTSNGIDSASGFLASEIPDVIQQLLMWHGIYNFLMFIVGLIFLAATYPVVKCCINFLCKAKVDLENREPWTVYKDSSSITSFTYDIRHGVFIIPFIQVLMAFSTINLKWLQIWIAPKVWLLEYAAKIVN